MGSGLVNVRGHGKLTAGIKVLIGHRVGDSPSFFFFSGDLFTRPCYVMLRGGISG